MAKAKKSKAKKSARKKPVKRAKARKAKKAKKPAPRKAVKAAAPKKKKQIVGEGDYAAAKAFDKAQTSFVKRNKAKIPRMAREAEQALDGGESASIKAAEQEAMSRSTRE